MLIPVIIQFRFWGSLHLCGILIIAVENIVPVNRSILVDGWQADTIRQSVIGRNLYKRANNIVIYDDDLLNTIMGNRTIYLSDADVDSIYNQLSQMNLRASVNTLAHVQNIQSAKRLSSKTIASGICPQC